MPWQPLPGIAFGVCVYPFQPAGSAELPLHIGDELYVVEQGGKDGSWYRGYLVAPPSVLAGLTSVKGQTLEARIFSGIFPRCCVEIRELLVDGERSAPGALNGNESLDANEEIPPVPANGVLTPSNSASPDARASYGANKSLARLDAPGEGTSIPVSRLHKAKSLRLTQRVSSQTVRSDALAQNLPMSPMSVISRDPNAPRPPAPLPALKVGDETQTSAQEPLVDEIASCLREWYTAKLHELLLARRYTTLDRMAVLVKRLDTVRRQLLHRVLTDQELRALREKTVWDLVTGNKMLCGEVIVRDPLQNGRILTADDSPIEVTKLQSMMSLLHEKPVHHTDEHMPHHLLVQFPGSFGELSTPKTIAVHLCIKTPGGQILPVSEVHAINISATTGSGSENTMKTLFINIGSTDIGEGAGAGSVLFVAFKVIVNEPLRAAQTQAFPRESTSSNGTNDSRAGHGTLKGRRSLMWSRSGDRGVTSPKSPEMRTIAEESRPNTKSDKMVKRTVAAAVIRVDHLLREDVEKEEQLTFWSSSTFPVEEGVEGEAKWDNVLKEVLPSNSGEYRKYPFPKAVKVFVKPFMDLDADALVKKTPTLLQHISQTRKIGFIGAPSKQRSDIYLSLSEIVIPRHAFLAHPKNGAVPMGALSGQANLQLTLEVRRSNGHRIENCIFPSCNSQGHTAWRTTACEKGEPWNLTIRLAISPEDVPGSHIVMSVADLPGFPFALCWMPLWNEGAFIEDGEHSLSLYQYDEYTSSIISGRGAYLALPWQAMKNDDHNGATMTRLQVRTFLCSTKYSQNPTLLGVLKWKVQPPGTLPGLLKKFSFVPEIEIVKLLNEVFDALFEILVDTQGSEEYERLVFTDLVFVLGIVHDRRFKLAPLVDKYAEEKFRYPVAGLCLVKAFIRLLSTPTDAEFSQTLRAAFKVARHLFKFIGAAWSHQERSDRENNRGNRKKLAFLKDVSAIFESLESLMKNPNPVLIGTKTLVVQHLHTWLPELVPIMPAADILQVAISFIDSCNNVKGKLILYKLILIINLSNIDAIDYPEHRRNLRVKTVRWLSDYWGKTEDYSEQWKEQVRLCCSVIASQLNELGDEGYEYIPKLIDSYRVIQISDRPAKKQLSLLFPTAYPFPSRPIQETTEFDEALAEIAAVLAGITSLPTGIHLDMPLTDKAEFLFSALQMYISVLDGEAYPQSWLSVHIYHHKSTMRSLEKLSSILIDSFLPHPDDAEMFDTNLWRTFFDALLKLVGSESLALETFPEQKRRAVWKIAGDVREQGADLLRRTWEAIGWETSPEDKEKYGLEKLGGYQVQYVPGLVGPIVELCLSVHDSLRRVAIQVLQTMIISEWTLNRDLTLPEAEIIECLDKLFKRKTINENVMQKQFLAELLELFRPLAERTQDDELLDAVKNLIATIDELLDHLIAVHASDGTSEAVKLMETLHLMEFLKNMQKVDIFIGYVHKLADIQAIAGNCTEAGLALRLHADLYEWDPSSVVEPLEDPHFPSQTSFERKEQLYFQMIKLYEDGQSWDNALGSYMELADQYEHNIFDFAKLARAQRAMATIYEGISRGQRDNPRYFRVVFHGLGFPVTLRDKEFIYQGLATDRMASFLDRMQRSYPNASVQSGGAGGVSGYDEGQSVHVYPVTAQKDINHPIYRRAKVQQSVRDYYLLSRPHQFASSSRRKPSDGAVKDQSVEKTIFTTAEAFPTILKKTEIVEMTTISLSPLQSAIERTTRKTAELAAFEKRLTAGEDTAAREALTTALEFAVDPSSPSSVANYRPMLEDESEQDKKHKQRDSHTDNEDSEDSDEEDEDEEDDEPKPLSPLQHALKIALLDHALTIKRCLAHFQRTAHQATRADLSQRFETTFAPELASLSGPPGTSDPVESTSWAAANHGPTPPRSGTISPAFQNPRHANPLHKSKSSGKKSPARTRSENKHRLSYIFTKRASTAGADDAPEAVNGGGDYRQHLDSGEGEASHAGAADDRPSTRQSTESTSESVRSRVGSVKKRLSLLGMGMQKKPSKASVMGNDVVREE
ncbi:putative SH3 and Ded_cyto domain protein [Microthyrium microscopicum]|uniref:Putative SH3 and Ded_cyto domain protein n=1 Tax=Microthyrium microscopicum TaxID=703497 RepID=A0A6A6U9B5_9PEZI|nr:putative SH3 and Ded_cyto domain protein [Microthyrium microscopicum]